MEWRERDGVRWLQATLPGTTAAFSTRTGGASAAPFDSLNLGILTGDASEAVRANRHRLSAALGIDAAAVLFARQVHGAEIQRRDRAPDPNPFAEPGPGLPEADGQATSAPGLAPLVLVADCLPVALSGPRGAAMLHCGWRGLAAGIVERGVKETAATAAAIGPGIGPCCYEVGPDVVSRFESLGEGVAAAGMLDLAEVARRLLRRAGVGAVQASELCTSCERDLFYSHRRDGRRTGRQGGLVWLGGDA